MGEVNEQLDAQEERVAALLGKTVIQGIPGGVASSGELQLFISKVCQ